MKTWLFVLTLLLPALARAMSHTPVTYPFTFVSLSGTSASGTAPVSQTDYDTGVGPNYFAGDRSNDPFIFSFDTPAGTVSYLDFFGFGYTLSADRSQLYANGSIAQMAWGGGFIFATFVTDLDGITAWTGGYQVGANLYTAGGTGIWSAADFEPAVGTVAVADTSGSTLLLLAIPLGLLMWMGRRGTLEQGNRP